jgi:hypothetical protein
MLTDHTSPTALANDITFQSHGAGGATARLFTHGSATPSGSSSMLTPTMQNDSRTVPIPASGRHASLPEWVTHSESQASTGGSPGLALSPLSLPSEIPASAASPLEGSPTMAPSMHSFQSVTRTASSQLSTSSTPNAAHDSKELPGSHVKASVSVQAPAGNGQQDCSAASDASEINPGPAIDIETVEFLQSQLHAPEMVEVGTSPMPSVILNGSLASGELPLLVLLLLLAPFKPYMFTLIACRILRDSCLRQGRVSAE